METRSEYGDQSSLAARLLYQYVIYVCNKRTGLNEKGGDINGKTFIQVTAAKIRVRAKLVWIWGS